VAQRLRFETPSRGRARVAGRCSTTTHARKAAHGEELMNLTKYVNAFVRDEEGQDLIEYALLVALISLVCVVALTDAGTQVNNIFTAIKNKLTTAAAAAP
jgi:pilus assembly protein Flp/PilA